MKVEMLSSILFPLRTNIKSLQRWGDAYDISGRIKQSMILYDEVIVEAGTFRHEGSDRFVLQTFHEWSNGNTREDVLREIEKIEKRKKDGHITHIDGKTGVEKHRYPVKKKNWFVADYRVVDVISEIESGSYGKEADFFKYAYILRKKNHKDIISQNTVKDLANEKLAETAERARNTYGNMKLVGLLNNLNDSLALSHLLKMPVSVDAMHAPLLRIKTECEVRLEFAILDRLAQIIIPDFSTLKLDSLLELRKHKALRSFRNMIWKINSQLQSKGTANMDKIFKEELLNAITEIAPTKKRLALNLALGALSLIPEPSVSIASTTFGVGKEFKEYKDFATNWLSFVLRARELD